jgi:hypothetical protein
LSEEVEEPGESQDGHVAAGDHAWGSIWPGNVSPPHHDPEPNPSCIQKPNFFSDQITDGKKTKTSEVTCTHILRKQKHPKLHGLITLPNFNYCS